MFLGFPSTVIAVCKIYRLWEGKVTDWLIKGNKYQRLTGTRLAVAEEDSELDDSGSDSDGSFEAMGETLIQHEIVRKEWY